MLKSIVVSFIVFGLATVANAEKQVQPKLRTTKELKQTSREQQEALTKAFEVMAAHPECGIRIVYFEAGKPVALPDESPECLASQAKK